MTEVAALVEELWPGKGARLEPLTGGHTNANFLIDVDGERLALRIPGKNTAALGIDRASELEAGQLAASIGVGPEVVAHGDEGWMVTRLLTGDQPEPDQLASEPLLADVASTLRRVHEAGSLHAVLNPYAVIGRYRDVITERGGELPFDDSLTESHLSRIEEVRPFVAAAFCHNDLRSDNFLLGETLHILDWEYAGMGDSFFDLANFSSNQQLPPEADVRLISHYFGRCDAAQLATLALMKIVSELRETYWNLVQALVSTLELPFDDFAMDRFARYEALCEVNDVEQLIERVNAAR